MHFGPGMSGPIIFGVYGCYIADLSGYMCTRAVRMRLKSVVGGVEQLVIPDTGDYTSLQCSCKVSGVSQGLDRRETPDTSVLMRMCHRGLMHLDLSLRSM